MSVTPFDALACPLDGSHPVRPEDSIWRGPAGRSHDIAHLGHVHLLPVQQRRLRDAGNSRKMVSTRRRFLNSGAHADRHRRLALGCGSGDKLTMLSVTVDVHLAQVWRDASG